jgi:serine/threonine protein kinase
MDFVLATGTTGVMKNDSWLPWLGRAVGAGSYGTGFIVSAQDAQRYYKDITDRMGLLIVKERLPTSGPVFVKIQRMRRPGGDANFVDDKDLQVAVAESAVHVRLRDAPCVTLPGMRPVCVAKHVPQFFYSGQVVDTHTKKRHYLTFMATAPGKALKDHLGNTRTRHRDARGRFIHTRNRGRISLHEFLAVERAVCAMWLNGYAHGDLHLDNMLYDRSSRHVTIIDFGFGMQLPANLVQDVRRKVVEAVRAGVRSLGEVWELAARSQFGTGLQQYANKVQYTRLGGGWYNPDGPALKRLFSRLSESDRAQVAAERRRLWGAKGGGGSPTSTLAGAGRGGGDWASAITAGTTSTASGRTDGSPMNIDSRRTSGSPMNINRAPTRSRSRQRTPPTGVSMMSALVQHLQRQQRQQRQDGPARPRAASATRRAGRGA